MTTNMESEKIHLTRSQKSNYAILCALTFIEGVEYAVILPTLYLRLKEVYHAPDYTLGLVFSAYYMTGMFSAPVMGRLYDKTRKPKLLLSAAIILSIVGNIMYWIGVDEWFVFTSRLIVGLGAGFNPVVLSEITHSTTEEQRTSIVSMVMAARQFGIMLGPGCNLFLRLTNFHIGLIVVDKFSSPGLFMAVIWLLLLGLHWIFYKTVTVSTKSTDDSTSASHSENKPGCLPKTASSVGQKGQIPQLPTQAALNDLLKEEYFAIFMLTLATLFNLIGFEALVTPLSNRMMFWRELEMGFLYLGISVLLLVGHVAVYYCGKRFEDRPMVIFGLVMQIISILFLVPTPILLQNPGNHLILNTAIFIASVMTCVAGLAFLFVCHISLLSKHLPKHMQGIGHGVRRTVGDVGSILGPLWCTSLIDNAYLMTSVMLSLHLTGLVLFIMSYKKLKTTDVIEKNFEMEMHTYNSTARSTETPDMLDDKG